MRAAREALSANSALLLGMALLTLGAGLQSTLLGVRATLANARVATRDGTRAAVDHLNKQLPPIMMSEDVAEGVRSFLERREAVFRGR